MKQNVHVSHKMFINITYEYSNSSKSNICYAKGDFWNYFFPFSTLSHLIHSAKEREISEEFISIAVKYDEWSWLGLTADLYKYIYNY